jgi:uncharacterized membrane protein
MDNHNNHSATTTGSKAQGSSLKWLGVCIGLIALAIIAVTIFRIPVSTVFFGALFLACPLMHVWMMKDGGHKH